MRTAHQAHIPIGGDLSRLAPALEGLHNGLQGRFGMKISSHMGVKEEAGTHVDDIENFDDPAFACHRGQQAHWRHPYNLVAILAKARGAPGQWLGSK